MNFRSAANQLSHIRLLSPDQVAYAMELKTEGVPVTEICEELYVTADYLRKAISRAERYGFLAWGDEVRRVA